MFNVSQIYRFKEIAYSHQGISSNPFISSYEEAKYKCDDMPNNYEHKCAKRWDHIWTSYH
jgi:hypothetical protein